jgi:hypothetical protein
MRIAPDVLGELREACCDNDVALRVTAVTPDRLLGLAPLAPARRLRPPSPYYPPPRRRGNATVTGRLPRGIVRHLSLKHELESMPLMLPSARVRRPRARPGPPQRKCLAAPWPRPRPRRPASPSPRPSQWQSLPPRPPLAAPGPRPRPGCAAPLRRPWARAGPQQCTAIRTACARPSPAARAQPSRAGPGLDRLRLLPPLSHRGGKRIDSAG